jgi:hypothetical protein
MGSDPYAHVGGVGPGMGGGVVGCGVWGGCRGPGAAPTGLLVATLNRWTTGAAGPAAGPVRRRSGGWAYSRRLHPAETAPPALMGRAPPSIEAKAVVRPPRLRSSSGTPYPVPELGF